ncbi:hypothetical protein FVR03_14510 [Pontibacter qinzhouensis]|uniref:Uncharacterized protein n=1 Tax=Pontibacter qinzhouensis TaxID=2603253 RepID=A0A5C8JI56_9BACT|nr:hypothetical protein [Pontibacter qinzhouensis]TXK38020.1 hypothetical protein FVR03_14510 [Pontibacter qinzhouensis]
MKNTENTRTRKDGGDTLGKKEHTQEVTKNPAPKEADRESETTPPENEVYVDIEPDELHPDDEPLDVSEEEK